MLWRNATQFKCVKNFLDNCFVTITILLKHTCRLLSNKNNFLIRVLGVSCEPYVGREKKKSNTGIRTREA